ncbi:MAG: BCD family MFS transporter [Chloroherpetonaceae bacterium]|nr:BCD family MFS transporter [Chloroherpetonaceae bacterium]
MATAFAQHWRNGRIIVQLAVLKVSVGWMYALLSSNFNRITIYELGIAAVLITTMLGVYHLASPFKVWFGKLSDERPMWGRHRTPYLFLGSMLSAIIFPVLPQLALAMSEGAVWAFVLGYVLLLLYGIGLDMAGSAHYALAAEVLPYNLRGMAVTAMFTMTIASTIFSAAYIKFAMPVYSFETMQELYALTPLIVGASAVLGLIGVEPQEKGATRKSVATELPSNVFKMMGAMLRRDKAIEQFFFFVLISTAGIFLQDSILEVFGASVLKMSVKETTSFQQIWGGGVLLGMVVMAIATAIQPLSKVRIALVGNYGTAAGLLLLSAVSLMEERTILYTALLTMGISTGLHTLGTVTTMMDLTVENAKATYMGLWGFAIMIGHGIASLASGGLVTLLIEQIGLAASTGYALIFLFEATLLVVGAAMLFGIDVQKFQRLNQRELWLSLEAQAD